MNYWKNLDLAPIEYFCEVDKIMKIEQWKDILGYEEIYQISDLGRVKSLQRFRIGKKNSKSLRNEFIFKQSLGTHKYAQISVCLNKVKKTLKIHQLVAIAFLNHKPCGHKLVINHKNFIRNENIKSNLEIVTNRENSNLKHIPSSSKYVGVCWDKQMKKWRSKIVFNGRSKFLGLFINEIDASNAYQKFLSEISST